MNDRAKTLNPAQLRAETAQRLWRVIHAETSESLDSVLSPPLHSPEQHAWMSAALYGCLRFYPRYQNQLYRFLSKPIKAKEGVVHALLILGMHQLSAMQLKAHAALNETVNACRALEKDWAVKLVNGILRNYQRELSNAVFKNEIEEFAHPKWMIKILKKEWPQLWQDILIANNRQAPMVVRFNASQLNRERALECLDKASIAGKAHPLVASALVLDKPVDVNAIPGFSNGYFSVQDAAAQMAASLLINDTDRTQDLNVLDACAAPGGKTGHLLERLAPESRLTALDVSPTRLNLIKDTLQRLGFADRKGVLIHAADASESSAWLDNDTFDRILLDAPCTASGVIRRHPDIKIRRSLQQLDDVVHTQAKILQALWPKLTSGGKLLYATCSVFSRENAQQIEQFVATHRDAKVIRLNLVDAFNGEFGSQIFPGSSQRDGFFYALLEKNKPI